MQKRKRVKVARLTFWLLILVVILVIVGCAVWRKTATVAPNAPSLPETPIRLSTVAEVSAQPEPISVPEAFQPDETEVEMLAQMLWGEARGISSDSEKAACVWCVLNRVDDKSGIWPDTIAGVLTQKRQFVGYSPEHPAPDDLKALAADVLMRWQQEKTEGGDVGRVLPTNYFFFTGDGQRNHFRAEYQDLTTWDWSLPSPYKN